MIRKQFSSSSMPHKRRIVRPVNTNKIGKPRTLKNTYQKRNENSIKIQCKSYYSKSIISLELGEPSRGATHKNQYPFPSCCWSQTSLTMVQIKMWIKKKNSFSVAKLLKSWGHPLSVPSAWLRDTNYYSLLRELLASPSRVFRFYSYCLEQELEGEVLAKSCFLKSSLFSCLTRFPS